jgi:hypothetical protein
MQLGSQMNAAVKSIQWGVFVRLSLTIAAGSLFLLLLKCGRGYPIAPTVCDALCAAENRIRCDAEVDPVLCVSQCESARELDAAGVPGGCDPARRDLAECVEALPDSDFSCEPGSLSVHRRQGTCLGQTLQLALCQSRDLTTWEDLCSKWAHGCSVPENGIDGGASRRTLYAACTSPYHYAASSCAAEQRSFVGCLLQGKLQCDTLPSRVIDVCHAERALLDGCEPRFTGTCYRWLFTCGGVDGGAEDRALAVQNCLRLRPIDVGPRCFVEREDFNDCLTAAWSREFTSRCVASPLDAPECAPQRALFEACAMSPNDGGS